MRPPAPQGSRRALLAAAPALLLVGCGSGTPEEQPDDPNVDLGTQKQGDVALLNQLLELEPSGGDAVAPLEQAVRTLGGRAVTPGGAREADAQRVYATYLDVVPKLADGRLRELCAGILADKAARIARLRIDAGQDAVPEAFVT